MFLGIAAIWIAFDQITKVILRETLDVGDHSVVTSFFRFSNVLNDGGAFGLFGGANVVLALSALVATVVIGLYYLFPPVDHWATRLGLALILGGAVGNLLDRIYQGSVTDFINFSHFSRVQRGRRGDQHRGGRHLDSHDRGGCKARRNSPLVRSQHVPVAAVA